SFRRRNFSWNGWVASRTIFMASRQGIRPSAAPSARPFSAQPVAKGAQLIDLLGRLKGTITPSIKQNPYNVLRLHNPDFVTNFILIMATGYNLQARFQNNPTTIIFRISASWGIS